MPEKVFPTVSVLIPVFNAAQSLHEAMDSILCQQETDFEVIAVDDGSTDNSLSILTNYAATDRRVVVRSIPHGGIVAALNAGLEAAQGRYIARMDADDICLGERFAKQASYLDDNPDTGLVACRVRFGGCATANAGYARYVDWTNTLIDHDDIALQRFRESPFAHPSVMFRASLTHRYGPYAEGSFPEDYELWLRWIEQGVRMHKLPDYLLQWNDPPQRLSRTDPRCSVEQFYDMKSAYLARWLHSHGHSTVHIIGAGKMSRRRAVMLREHGITIAAWIDVDPKKIGNIVDGVKVHGREALPPQGSGFALAYLAGHGAAEELEAYLASIGYCNGRDYLLAS